MLTLSLTTATAQGFVVSYPYQSVEVRGDLPEINSQLAKLDAAIKRILNNPEQEITNIRITGYSSVDGDYASNETLARDRAEQFYRFFVDRYPSLRGKSIDLAWVAEDWTTFAEQVRRSGIAETDEIIQIIRYERVYDDRELLIRKLNGGLAWQALETRVFPALRRVEIDIQTGVAQPNNKTADNDPLVYNVLQAEPDPRHNRSLAVLYTQRPFEDTYYLPVRTIRKTNDYRFAVKTNLLHWAGVQPDFTIGATVLNLAFDYYFNQKWSVGAAALYSYWNDHSSDPTFQGMSGYSIEGRRHFIFKGFLPQPYVGVYAKVGDYDNRRQQNTVNYTGDYWEAGLSAGLTVPVVYGFCVEAGVRVGYMQTTAIRYTKDGRYNWYDYEMKVRRLDLTELILGVAYRF